MCLYSKDFDLLPGRLEVQSMAVNVQLLLNHHKRLRLIQRCLYARYSKQVNSSIDTPRSSLLRSASKTGHVVICLIFVIMDPIRNFFRSVDQVLLARKNRPMSAADLNNWVYSR